MTEKKLAQTKVGNEEEETFSLKKNHGTRINSLMNVAFR